MVLSGFTLIVCHQWEYKVISYKGGTVKYNAIRKPFLKDREETQYIPAISPCKTSQKQEHVE